MSSSCDGFSERTSQPPMEHMQGIVERVTHHAEFSGYTVARLKAPGHRDIVTIVGRFPDIHVGQSLRLTGYWREHAKYGQQFQVVQAQETKPATLTGLEKYLGSGLIKRQRCQREDTIAIAMSSPSRSPRSSRSPDGL